MTTNTTAPKLISDDTLEDISGGPEYLAPGVYIEEVSLAQAAMRETEIIRTPVKRRR
ncbi:MAG: hypothetical protein AAGD13_18835 [Pseudomonadota bacterium]